MRTIRDVDLNGKRVLLRSDFNVPLNEDGSIADDFRIKQTIPTIRYALEQNARVILMSHLGKPNGRVQDSLRLASVGALLEKELNVPVPALRDCVGKDIEKRVQEIEPGAVVLLENLRFYEEEEENDETFAKELAELGELYVNDAFGVSHRSHASVVGIPRFLPSCAGLLLEKEIQTLSQVIAKPARPFVVIVGGSKVKTKLRFIERMTERADFVLLGNLLAEEAVERGIEFSRKEKIVAAIDGIEVDGRALDIGPKTRVFFGEKIRGAKTVFWNGPLGLVEDERFGEGSKHIAEAVIKETGAYSMAGGGNLNAFLGKYGFRDRFSHISTGGGAMLAFAAGETLPGLKALEQNE